MKKRNDKDVRKCDVIIPIFNAPEWVKLCVYSLFKNTPNEYINKIYLMDDCSDLNTKDCLNNLAEKYAKKIEIITNTKNLGFVKNVNKGLKISEAEYVLLLNSDCLLAKNTIPKLINHITNNSKIGLICPVSNNAANLSLDMLDGFSYIQMDALLEKKFSGINYDACTIVGNCLLLTRECIEKVGLLDEAYGIGYGEETDYHFEALSLGFEAKVAIDTYVFHKAEASFGNSKEKEIRILENRELFFSRWGKEYEIESTKYHQNDPIKYITENIGEDDKLIKSDTLFYLPFVTQSAGGCHTVVDIVNYLVINGESINILYNIWMDYQEITLFKPIHVDFLDRTSMKRIVPTIWLSTFLSIPIAEEREIPIINFVQGYENYFENGRRYESVGITHKIADYELTISYYLRKKIKEIFGKDSRVIQNGINYDLLKRINTSKIPQNITFALRDNVMKGDFLVFDIIKLLDKNFKNLNITVIDMTEESENPSLKNSKFRKITGPLNRYEIVKIFKETDIYVDTSINEGFGLMALEAMTCGAVPVVSNSFGINEYMRDGKNGFIINEVNDVEKYLEKISAVIKNPNLYSKMKEYANGTVKDFDIDDKAIEYIKYFNSIDRSFVFDKKEYTENEKKIINSHINKKKENKRNLSIRNSVVKVIPMPLRKILKKIIIKLYFMFDHSN